MLLCLNTAIKACALRFVRNFPDSQKIKQKCKKKFKSIYPECGIMYHISRKTSVCGADICFHRDNEQTVCGADRERSARVCEYMSSDFSGG